MKALGMLALALALVLLGGCALAQEMIVYVQPGALDAGEAQQILSLLQAELGGDEWKLAEDGLLLRDRVIAGNLPDLVICTPSQARPWAKEGLLLPLQTIISGQQRMQSQVLDLCVQGEELFMAPLIARHRQMAVNVSRFDEMGLGYMLDAQTYPVWYPAQFYQILEEFLIRDEVAMDVWRAQAETSAALEALAQAIYGGMLLSEDGQRATADDEALWAGVQWLRDSIDDEMIGYCETREDALERFLEGETAIFVDWMNTLERQAADRGMEIVQRPYPSAMGLPVRSFELVGVCAFAGGDTQRGAKLAQACAVLHEHAQHILGGRGIWQDGALWPASMEAELGATLRSLFCQALCGVIEAGEDVREALEHVQAAMDVLEQTK